MKKILYFTIILIASLLFFIPVINAKPTGYYKKISGSCNEYPDIPGFCIQSGVDYNRTKTYYTCDAGLSCFEAAAAYYGYTVDTSKYWQAQRLLNGRAYYTDSNCNNEIGTTDAENYANSYCTTPYFGSSTLNLKVGDVVTFTDYNSVMSNYSIASSSSAYSVTKTSNGINITALSEISGAEIILYKGSTSAIVGYCSNESQNYVTASRAPYVSTKITINISKNTSTYSEKYGILRLQKVDENNDPLEGVKFKVGTNLNGIQNTDWKYELTNSSGIITISNIPVGTSYYYQEVGPLEGYQFDNSIKYIYISSESTFTRKIVNLLEDTGMVKIIKTNQYNERLSNVKFKIGTNLTGVEGTDWSAYFTDNNGEITIPNLAINTTLYAQEIETIEGHTFNPDAVYRLVINDEQLYDTITIVNTLEVDRLLKIIKRTTETNELLPNVKINIYNKSDDTLYAEKVTDENGEIYITDIEDGEYYLEEVEAPVGHIKLKDKVNFTISEDTPEVTLELFNDLKNAKTGNLNILIPFSVITILSIGAYFILKTKQKII